MPKPHTFPTLFDEVQTITINFLCKHGYLKTSQLKSGTITWSSDGNTTGSISIQVNTHHKSQSLDLSYRCNEALINYRVLLVSVASNLGKGVIWFFICPYTGKRCIKLYLINNYFYHRTAFQGCMYEKQTHSHIMRRFHTSINRAMLIEQLNEKLSDKHAKKTYAGKPTKQMAKLLKLTNSKNKL